MQRGFWEFVNEKISPADCRLAFSFRLYVKFWGGILRNLAPLLWLEPFLHF